MYSDCRWQGEFNTHRYSVAGAAENASFAPPGQVNSFFNLSGDLELDSRAVTVDGHDACILKGVWSHLCDC